MPARPRLSIGDPSGLPARPRLSIGDPSGLPARRRIGWSVQDCPRAAVLVGACRTAARPRIFLGGPREGFAIFHRSPPQYRTPPVSAGACRSAARPPASVGAPGLPARSSFIRSWTSLYSSHPSSESVRRVCAPLPPPPHQLQHQDRGPLYLIGTAAGLRAFIFPGLFHTPRSLTVLPKKAC